MTTARHSGSAREHRLERVAHGEVLGPDLELVHRGRGDSRLDLDRKAPEATAPLTQQHVALSLLAVQLTPQLAPLLENLLENLLGEAIRLVQAAAEQR